MTARLWVFLATCALLILVASVFRSHLDDGPVYRGRPLALWLDDYRKPPGQWAQADEAVRNAGTNAIPLLLRMLQKRNWWLTRFAARHPILKVIPPGELNREASFAFSRLGTNAAPAVPDLVRIYENRFSVSSQIATGRALVAIGPAARPAIPSFLRELVDTNEVLRNEAIGVLTHLHTEPDVILNGLTNALTNRSAQIRLLALDWIEQMGPAAKPAIPALTNLVNDPSQDVQGAAENALRAIQ